MQYSQPPFIYEKYCGFSFMSRICGGIETIEHFFFECNNYDAIRTALCNVISSFGWSVVLGFNATLIAKVILWRSVTHMCFLAFSHQYLHNVSFQSHRLLFSHASAEVRGENTPERKVSSTGDRTHNHQVMSRTRSRLSHPGGTYHHLEILILSYYSLINVVYCFAVMR